MDSECMIDFKSVVNSTDIEKIKQFFKELASSLKHNNCDKDFEKTIISKIKREINKYKKDFKRRYSAINNLYVYPENQSFLYFCSKIIEFREVDKSNFDFLECINTCLEILDGWDFTRTKHVSFDEQMELLFMADKKFDLFSLLDSTDRVFNLYNFPCLFNDESCDIMATEYPKGTIIDLLLFDQKMLDIDAKFYMLLF